MPHAQTHKYVEKDGDKVEHAEGADGNEGRLRKERKKSGKCEQD